MCIRDRRNEGLRTVKMSLTLHDKQCLAAARAPFNRPGEATETSSLHPHYCVGRPATALDTELNQGHTWGVEHREKPTGSQHRYTSMRDTRDLMNREMPLVESRKREAMAVSDGFLNQANNYLQGAPPAEAQAPPCLLYTSDAADEEDSVDLGGSRIIKKKKGKER
eukprot:TRINITY_DN45848_c0_g1_i1.p1 TRINITY_DN45848_c0_g1~~TRINITY_DN45848_c0_g1_i1.p1  ORF type:complete len:166 (-),score=37.93 TRINITY_DN45848_c0_g1_i1:55-552(-)